ncbi:aldehyde dehydrogenase family protein, partial [Pseudonocardia pini]|uniref:aldehyde dehydrogenase family protein n=1 Tax=Pseudonocardia pini TaxID=2758030 RepID=UPI0015EFEF90
WRDWLAEHSADLVDLVQQETGKSYGDAVGEPAYGIQVTDYWLEHAEAFLAPEHPESAVPTHRLEISHHPYPLVGVISPWNGPLTMPMLDIPAALMAGAAVLSKPSELTPLTWAEAVRGWREIGAPDVLGIATGDGATGAAVVDVVDFIQFTGSVRTGRAVAARAGERLIPSSLELGGKDPLIVLADADLDRAARAAVWGACVFSGQGCSAVERVYVEDAVYADFVARVVDWAGRIRQGTVRGEPYVTDIGAMSSEAQLRIVEEQVDAAVAAGARALTGGARLQGPGWYYPPTVLVDVTDDMAVMREETFGPVVPIARVADAAEALRRANDSEFGLSGSVFTADRERGSALAAQVEVGAICVNDVCTTNFHLSLPSGGWKSSGIGARFGGAAGIRKYTRAQATLTLTESGAAEPHWYPILPPTT